jgi:hypothetical protein
MARCATPDVGHPICLHRIKAAQFTEAYQIILRVVKDLGGTMTCTS